MQDEELITETGRNEWPVFLSLELGVGTSECRGEEWKGAITCS